MPNQPSTPNRAVRVVTELWDASKRAAAMNEETVTDVVIRGLISYCKRSGTLPKDWKYPGR